MRFGVETEAESFYTCIHVSITWNQLMRIYLLFEQLKHKYVMTATQSSRLGDSFKTCAKRQIFAKEEYTSLISKTFFVVLIRNFESLDHSSCYTCISRGLCRKVKG